MQFIFSFANINETISRSTLCYALVHLGLTMLEVLSLIQRQFQILQLCHCETYRNFSMIVYRGWPWACSFDVCAGLSVMVMPWPWSDAILEALAIHLSPVNLETAPQLINKPSLSFPFKRTSAWNAKSDDQQGNAETVLSRVTNVTTVTYGEALTI